MKTFYVQHNIGKAKHVINFHDGVKQHPDGSPFFDIRILKNKKALKATVDGLLADGYVET